MKARREFLREIASLPLIGGGAMVVSAAMPALAAPEHPDAELLALVALHAAATVRRDEFDRQADAAIERLDYPEIPSALLWRGTDHPFICLKPENLAIYLVNGERCPAYENGVSDLSLWAQAYAKEGDAYRNAVFTGRDRARTREIMVAHAEYQAACGRAEDAVGAGPAIAAADRETRIINELIGRIARKPALTADGVAAKAQAGNREWYSARNQHWLEQEYLPRLLAQDAAETDTRHLFTVSLIVDAMRLGEGCQPEGER